MKIEVQFRRFVNNKTYDHHLHIPKEIGDLFVDEENRRVICTFSNRLKIQSGLMPYPEGYFILLNRKRSEELNLIEGDFITISIEKDHSKYGMPLPEELEAILEEDTQFESHFEKLTQGKQRNLIYIINSVKNPESRLSKALAIAAHLTEHHGALDFKLLNEKIKEFNELR